MAHHSPAAPTHRCGSGERHPQEGGLTRRAVAKHGNSPVTCPPSGQPCLPGARPAPAVSQLSGLETRNGREATVGCGGRRHRVQILAMGHGPRTLAAASGRTPSQCLPQVIGVGRKLVTPHKTCCPPAFPDNVGSSQSDGGQPWANRGGHAPGASPCSSSVLPPAWGNYCTMGRLGCQGASHLDQGFGHFWDPGSQPGTSKGPGTCHAPGFWHMPCSPCRTHTRTLGHPSHPGTWCGRHRMGLCLVGKWSQCLRNIRMPRCVRGLPCRCTAVPTAPATGVAIAGVGAARADTPSDPG